MKTEVSLSVRFLEIHKGALPKFRITTGRTKTKLHGWKWCCKAPPACFFVGLYFDPEDGGDISLRSVRHLLKPSRPHSSVIHYYSDWINWQEANCICSMFHSTRVCIDKPVVDIVAWESRNGIDLDISSSKNRDYTIRDESTKLRKENNVH